MKKELLYKIMELKGIIQDVPANYRRFLAYPDSLWVLVKGEGVVFAMERSGALVTNGVLDKGPLTFLRSANLGSLFFGFEVSENDPIAILFITHTASVFKKISVNELDKFIKSNPKSAKEFVKPLEDWINQFISQTEFFTLQEEGTAIAAGKTLIVEEGEVITPFHSVDPKQKENVIWVQIIEGEAFFYGFPSHKLNAETGIFPLHQASWLTTNSQVKIKGYSTKDALLKESVWKGFKAYQDFSLKMIQLNVERKELAFIKRVKEKEKLDALSVDHALKHMTTALEKKPLPILTSSQDRLLRACQIVGHELDITFHPSKEKKNAHLAHQALFEICEASGCRSREVTLDPGFWKKDSLSILGFYKESHEPVALINHAGKGYEIIDPMTLKRLQLNSETEKLLSKEAYTFYKPFGEGKITGWKALQFIMRGKRRELLTIAIVGIIGGFLSLFPPFFTKVIFDEVITNAQASLLWQVIIGLLIVALSSALFLLTRSLTMLRLTSIIDLQLESALWDRILNLPIKFFRQFTVGNLIDRVYSVSQIHQLVSGTAVKVLLSGIFSLFYFFAMLAYSPLLAIIGLAIISLNIFISLICVIYKTVLQRKILAFQGTINGIVVQIISGVAKLRTSGAENRAFAYWSSHYTEYKRLTQRSQTIQNIVTTTTAILPIFSYAILFTIVMFIFKEDVLNAIPTGITIGSLIAFFAAFVPFSSAIFDVSNTFINIVQAIPLWERSKVILEEVPENAKEKIKIEKLTGDLLVDHVSFRYETSSPLVLDDISLYANPGEYIGIVGPSGCGKSTLMRLLLGFEHPENGSIYYNGHDLSSLDLKRIRHQIGSVLQNGSIFSGTLYDNIVCGGTYSKEEVEYALKLSGFEEDLHDLPMGLHTVVQSGGGSFSGGQLQRLLIARALISKPKILIFDEATSALDNRTQDLISHNLDELKVTRIVIAHRLTTIRNADRIYVIESGKVIQVGSFEELANQEGLFQQMLNRQRL